jgi:Uma2 family endonuclease
MSTGASPGDPRSVLAQEPQRRLSVDDYHRMIAAGVLEADERIELLEGVIVEMSPQTPRPGEVISRLCDPEFVTAGPDWVVRAQLPLSLGQASEPEPDVAVVRRRPGGYSQAHPTTGLLVFEVAAGSLRKDRVLKAAIYARAGIPEYVVVNLDDDCLEVQRDPDVGSGEYRSRSILRPGDRFVSAGVPSFTFEVLRLLA